MSQYPPFGRAVSVPKNRSWRTARIGGMALGIAGNVALQRAQGLLRGERPDLRDLLMTPGNIGRMTNELARMRGAAMKLGQLISMDAGDFLPPEMSRTMARLRAEADFMPPPQLKKVLTRAWGAGWLRRFERFDIRPIAAASIGQVHRARLVDGREIAIKVQYPGIAQSIDSDLANVATLAKLSGLVPEGFDIGPYVEQAGKQLHDETDYLAEAAHLKTFAGLLEGSDRYELPQVLDELTVPTVLTMSFVESEPLEAVADLSQSLRDQIAGDLIDLVLRELFEFGIVQSDPNFANFRYNPRAQRLVLLDFGATRKPEVEVIQAYRAMIIAGLGGDREGLHAAARRLGVWDETTRPEHVARISDMMDRVLAEIGKSDVFDFADRGLMREMNADGIALAESGFVPPPAPIDVLFIQRKLAGVFLIASNLKARVPLRAAILNRLHRD